MGTTCAPFIAGLFIFYYFSWCLFLMILKLMSLKPSTQRLDILNELLNIDNPYFEGTVSQIYPTELQLNKANTSDAEASFFIYIYQL